MDDCRLCPLWQQAQSNPIPDGTQLAWTAYQKLSGPAVEKFGMQDAVFELMGIDLDRRRAQALIDQLNAIVEGLRVAGEELNREKGRQAR